ncbi:MAG: DUF87 domain-containing protein, partial [Candidatus Peregrinibacteria bacterium]|nr:DUF87 domain-containing protein [Candidatus Peregrinibacteria bacterium]
MKLHYLHIVVPQGEEANPKKEDLFRQVLINLQNTVKNKTLSLEFFGYEQYTYCYVVVPEDLKETVEGLIYSTFPDCEIHETKDYTRLAQEKRKPIAGTTLKFNYFDIYPFKNYESFKEDSQSGLFSVISKIASGEQVWVQMVIRPVNESTGYHFKRNWAIRFARIRQIFHVKDWFRPRDKAEQSIRKLRAQRATEKFKEKPFDVVVRLAYVGNDQVSASRKLEAVVNSFYQFNDTDIQEFRAGRTTHSASFLHQYQKRSTAGGVKMGAKELASLYHYPNPDHTPHIVHVLAKKSEPPQDLPKADQENVSPFGITNYHNNFVPFGIHRSDRRRHLYAVGKSGSGKSKFLELLIKSDFETGQGVAVLDPHGDLIDNVIRYIPEHRINDVIIFDPSDVDFPIAFNPLENVGDEYKMQV